MNSSAGSTVAGEVWGDVSSPSADAVDGIDDGSVWHTGIGESVANALQLLRHEFDVSWPERLPRNQRADHAD